MVFHGEDTGSTPSPLRASQALTLDRVAGQGARLKGPGHRPVTPIRPGDMVYTLYRRHPLHFYPLEKWPLMEPMESFIQNTGKSKLLKT